MGTGVGKPQKEQHFSIVSTTVVGVSSSNYYFLWLPVLLVPFIALTCWTGIRSVKHQLQKFSVRDPAQPSENLRKNAS